MSQTISSGTVSDLTVSGLGDVVTVIDSGVLAGASIIFGGGAIASAGGALVGEQVSAGGYAIVSAGGVSLSATIFSGAAEIVRSGLTGGDTINGVQSLLSGGTAIKDSIGSGGTQIISSGGIADDDFVSWAGKAGPYIGGIGLVDVFSGGTESGGSLGLLSEETVYWGGTALGTELVAQATLSISAGGFASGATASAMFSAIDVWAGGTQIDGSDASYGTDYVYTGGTTINETVSATGLERLRGGIASGSTVLSGATQSIESGSWNFAATIHAGGTQIVSNGITSNDTIDGLQLVSAGAEASNDTVGGGGNEFISAGGIEINTIVSGGTDFLAAGAVEIGAVTFAGPGGDLVVGSGGIVDVPIFGFVSGSGSPTFAGNMINLRGFGTGAVVTTVAPDLVVVTSGGNVLALDIVGAVIGESFRVVADPNGGVDIIPCFLEGTHVLAADGEKRIEELSVGDLVVTRGPDGNPVLQPVTWIGKRSLRAADLPEGERYPVRIRSGAFGTGLPHRDLLITQEHCVFVDGLLVPARMLVNDRNIVNDHTISAYTIYHVELAHHAVLFAEGLTMESYLDTGNRANFQNDDAVAMRPDFSLNEQSSLWSRAVAPLTVDRKFVEPIWTELEQRAARLGFPRITPAPALTCEPDLHLMLDGGLRIEALAVQDKRHQFVIPPNTSTVRLVSRAARPSEVVGPFLDDRRQLGVMVGEIVGYIGKHRNAETAHLARQTMPGWHAIEGDRARWTDGNALLPIDLGAVKHKPMLLEIEIVHCGPYLIDETVKNNHIAAA